MPPQFARVSPGQLVNTPPTISPVWNFVSIFLIVPVTFGLACLGFRWSVRRSPVFLWDLHKFSLRSSLVSSLLSYLSPFIISSLSSQTKDFLSNSSLPSNNPHQAFSLSWNTIHDRFVLAPPMLRSIGSTYFTTQEDTQTLRIDQLTSNIVAVFTIGFHSHGSPREHLGFLSERLRSRWRSILLRFSRDPRFLFSSLSRSREEYASETGAFRQRRVVCSTLRNHWTRPGRNSGGIPAFSEWWRRVGASSDSRARGKGLLARLVAARGGPRGVDGRARVEK